MLSRNWGVNGKNLYKKIIGILRKSLLSFQKK